MRDTSDILVLMSWLLFVDHPVHRSQTGSRPAKGAELVI